MGTKMLWLFILRFMSEPSMAMECSQVGDTESCINCCLDLYTVDSHGEEWLKNMDPPTKERFQGSCQKLVTAKGKIEMEDGAKQVKSYLKGLMSFAPPPSGDPFLRNLPWFQLCKRFLGGLWRPAAPNSEKVSAKDCIKSCPSSATKTKGTDGKN
jgi:hypothetical protein